MATVWPATLRPSSSSFWLEANTAVNISPLSRTTQVLIRQGARWRSDLAFNARNKAVSGQLDGLLASLDGPGGEVWLFDFRRPFPLGTARIPVLNTFTDGTIFNDGTQFTNSPHMAAAAATGDELAVIAGLMPSSLAFCAGDYVGIGGYLYMSCGPAYTDATGKTSIQVRPRLRSPSSVGDGVNINMPGARFRLADNGQGTNRTMPGLFSSYTISLLESLP